MYSVHVFVCFFLGGGHKSEEECRGEVLWPMPSHTATLTLGAKCYWAIP